MFQRAFLFFILSSSWALGQAEISEINLDSFIDQRCYLRAHEMFHEKFNDAGPAIRQHYENRIAAFVNQSSSSARLNFAEQDYLKGYLSWAGQATQTACGFWLKYLEKRRREEGFKPDPQFLEVHEFYNRYKEVFEIDVSTRVVSQAPRSVKGRRYKSAKKIRPAIMEPDLSSKVRVQDLCEEAERLRTRGQLEQALRLYRLAGRITPHAARIQDNISSIEREIR